MSNVYNGLTRRDFLRNTAGVTLAAAGAAAQAEETGAPAAGKSRVVLVRDADALDAAGKPNSGVLQQMLDTAVTTLLGETDPVAAWKGLVKPADMVGVKSNVSGPPRTPKELEVIIRRRLMDAGISPERISVNDRGVLRDPVFMKSTALVNVRPMLSHHWAGVGSLIKNYLMFSPNPPSWHGDACADLAGLWDLPIVKGKTRLNILVMLIPLFHGKGPHHYSKEYTWPYKGLIVSTDPVAADATGLRILQAKRRAHFGEDQPFPVSPKHIRVAQDKFHLGIADAERIELMKLGWQEDILI